MKVQKHSGNIVDFDREKLKRSLLKSGAGTVAVDNVLQLIEQQLYDGISTKKIYKLAGKLLKRISASHAARYNLRSALQLLGPDGFFFEKFVARLFAYEGYQAMLNLNLQGHCVKHEIDIVIQKKQMVTMIECKFHNSNAVNSDVKVPMYILSRFNDLKDNSHRLFTNHDKISRCCIATNNRFTTDAIAFASCMGIELLSWDYPKTSNLKSKIDLNGLYPITCLTTLSSIEKEKLLILDVILVRELIDDANRLTKIGISPGRINNIIKEAHALCNYNGS